MSIVFSGVSDLPSDTSCRKKTIPSVTHLRVACDPLALGFAKRSPDGELTCISTAEVPLLIKAIVATPNPEPSVTRMGFGLIEMLPPTNVTLAIVFAAVKGKPLEVFCR